MSVRVTQRITDLSSLRLTRRPPNGDRAGGLLRLRNSKWDRRQHLEEHSFLGAWQWQGRQAAFSQGMACPKLHCGKGAKLSFAASKPWEKDHILSMLETLWGAPPTNAPLKKLNLDEQYLFHPNDMGENAHIISYPYHLTYEI